MVWLKCKIGMKKGYAKTWYPLYIYVKTFVEDDHTDFVSWNWFIFDYYLLVRILVFSVCLLYIVALVDVACYYVLVRTS
jgi:hypothetical protein